MPTINLGDAGKMKLLVIIPTYNEIENIKKVNKKQKCFWILYQKQLIKAEQL